jgi:hypothetical protein
MIPAKPSEADVLSYVDNIVYAYGQTSARQREAGRQWYHVAHDLANILGDGDVRVGAGVLAALSANKSWRANVKIAERVVAGVLTGHTRDNLAKAARILSGDDPEDVLPMHAKTGNFFRCIADPTDPDPVCVDRHAHDVAVGEVYGDRDRGLGSKSRYAAIALAYRMAALKIAEKEPMIASELQAITWVWQTERLAGTSTRGRMYGSE